MKKLIIIITIILSFLLITGCRKEEEKKKEPIKNNSNYNSLVLYFSATGTTKKVAKKIAIVTQSDIIEIIPTEKYKDEDLNYNSDCRANREQNNPKARPPIKNTIDISQYDVIYLGYPIWWGTNPKIILTLLDTYDFSNKIIIPFCTSGSTDINGSVNDLRKYNPKLTILTGRRFTTDVTTKEILEFTDKELNTMKVKINDVEYEMTLENNDTVKELMNYVPFKGTMQELNGNEKYLYLDKSFKTNSTNPKRINKGDVMFYGDNCLVLFYESFDTTYSYTKLGHIDNLPNLGNDSISIEFIR